MKNFSKLLKKFGIKSPDELDDEEKKKFLTMWIRIILKNEKD